MKFPQGMRDEGRSISHKWFYLVNACLAYLFTPAEFRAVDCPPSSSSDGGKEDYRFQGPPFYQRIIYTSVSACLFLRRHWFI